MSFRTTTVRHRGEVLAAVVEEADRRLDGTLPFELPGVAETYGDELGLIAALQLRWNTRLAGRIERALLDRPAEPEEAVITAWRTTAAELPGVRLVLDEHTARPQDEAMATALTKAAHKEWTLLAGMAGLAGTGAERTLCTGRELEARARSGFHPATTARATVPGARRRAATPAPRGSLMDRLRARLAA